MAVSSLEAWSLLQLLTRLPLPEAQVCTPVGPMALVSCVFPFRLWEWPGACPCVGERAVWKLQLKSELFGEPPALLVLETLAV